MAIILTAGSTVPFTVDDVLPGEDNPRTYILAVPTRAMRQEFERDKQGDMAAKALAIGVPEIRVWSVSAFLNLADGCLAEIFPDFQAPDKLAAIDAIAAYRAAWAEDPGAIDDAVLRTYWDLEKKLIAGSDEFRHAANDRHRYLEVLGEAATRRFVQAITGPDGEALDPVGRALPRAFGRLTAAALERIPTPHQVDIFMEVNRLSEPTEDEIKKSD